MAPDLSADIAAVQGIAAVPRILEVVCRSTGMGFAAVARVTEERWICCAVRDEIEFGLTPGGELEVETTICHEIRQSGEAVVIDNVAEDAVFCGHHTPAMYGFQSYISVPIILPDGAFFGTLCAIDPRPARLNTPETVGMFKLFAELIAFHLDAAESPRCQRSGAARRARDGGTARAVHRRARPRSAQPARLDRGRHASCCNTALDRTQAPQILALMQQSVARMAALIDNVLDFARGRLGGGLALNRRRRSRWSQCSTRSIAELRAGWPERADRDRFRPDAASRLRPRPHRPAVFQPARQRADPWRRRAPGPGARATRTRRLRAVGRQCRRADPAEPIDRLFQPFYRGARRRASRAWAWASTSPPRSPAPMAARSTWPRRRRRRASRSGCRCGETVGFASVNRRGQLLGDTALAFCRHVNAVGWRNPLRRAVWTRPSASMVLMPRACNCLRISARLDAAVARFIPFIASLPAICRMTILVPGGTALDRRASMPPVVSPLTPALLTDIGRPLARRIASSCAGYAADAPTPYPAVLLAPRATICALALVIAPKPSSKMIEHLNMRSIPRLAYRHGSQLPVTLSMQRSLT